MYHMASAKMHIHTAVQQPLKNIFPENQPLMHQ